MRIEFNKINNNEILDKKNIQSGIFTPEFTIVLNDLDRNGILSNRNCE